MARGKNVLITGASSGIGEAMAYQFAKEGWNLILVARRQNRLEVLAEKLAQRYHARSNVICLDLTQSQAPRVLFDELASRNLPVDCLVNNAGRGDFGPFDQQDWRRDEETIALNVTSLTSLCHLFAPAMLERGNGYILNVASIAGFMPGPNFAVYHATKAYVLSLSQALNAEWSARGVSVTASCPGVTRSEFFDHSGTDKLKALEYVPMMTPEKVAAQAYKATLKRQPIVVHGLLNKALVEGPRLLPHGWVAPLVNRIVR